MKTASFPMMVAAVTSLFLSWNAKAAGTEKVRFESTRELIGVIEEVSVEKRVVVHADGTRNPFVTLHVQLLEYGSMCWGPWSLVSRKYTLIENPQQDNKGQTTTVYALGQTTTSDLNPAENGQVPCPAMALLPARKTLQMNVILNRWNGKSVFRYRNSSNQVVNVALSSEE